MPLLKKIKRKHSPKDSCDIYLNNDQVELKTSRNSKPLNFEKNSNDIAILNNKVNEVKEKKEENINDIDDEGIIHETHGYKNFFKGFEIYQNKLGMNPYSEPNIYEYMKNYEVKKSF